MNGKVTSAPDKRVEGGAVPPTSTNSEPLRWVGSCHLCYQGLKRFKMKRYYIHYVDRQIHRCLNQGP